MLLLYGEIKIFNANKNRE